MANVKQLSLELRQYPRPIAWTISEVDRAVGDRDRRDMLLAAFEEILRYLVLLELARYVEYRSGGHSDPAIERSVADLQRPTFGQLLGILTALDQYLTARSDPFALRIAEKRDLPRMKQLCEEVTQSRKFNRLSVAMFLSEIVTLRNREKGHGYTGQLDARARTALLQPALIELLEKTPLLIDLPLVWVESIEYLDPKNWNVTFLELMGTQRARRLTRSVHDPGTLRKNFLYMWNGEEALLQMTPFLHLEEAGHDEVVYVLAGVSGEPFYQTRGSSTVRRPDHLQTQLEERVPFLLQKPRSITNPRLPGAKALYRRALEIALADGALTPQEEEKLDAFRDDIGGLTQAEVEAIHRDLGLVVQDNPQTAAPAEVDPLLSFARNLRDALAGQVEDNVSVVLLDDEIDVNKGRLWLQLSRGHGIALRVAARKPTDCVIAIGFDAQDGAYTDQYEHARQAIAMNELAGAFRGWERPDPASQLYGSSALELRKHISLADLGAAATKDDVLRLMLKLADLADEALAAVRTSDEPAALVEVKPPVSASVPDDFPLPRLSGGPRLQGSIWLARILWALEHGRRSGAGPLKAADIARILQQNGVDVPNTNTARAFRIPKDDPRTTGLCDEPASQQYAISDKGRRVLYEWLPSAMDEDEPAEEDEPTEELPASA